MRELIEKRPDEIAGLKDYKLLGYIEKVHSQHILETYDDFYLIVKERLKSFTLSSIVLLTRILENIPYRKKQEFLELIDQRMQNIIKNEDINENDIFEVVGVILTLQKSGIVTHEFLK
jgi:hypothetical protein